MKRSTIVALGLIVTILCLRDFALPAFAEQTLTPTVTVTLTRTVRAAATSSPTVSATSSAAISRTVTATPTATRRITTTVTLTGTLTITPTSTLTTTATSTSTPTITATPTISGTATPTLTPSPTSTPTITPTPTVTPIRYPLPLDPNALSIDALRARPYGGGGIKMVKTVFTSEAYSQVLIEYVSDGLKITGTMNIPYGLGPFPVVILDHGYFKPAEYKTGDGTSKAADSFARRGYLTIASDYRCYAGSQCATNPFYIGYAIDVLNLIAQLPSISYADPTRVGIWGHSMGGNITLRVLAVNDSIKVASLYGALTGDDEVHYCWLIGCKGALVTPVPSNQFRLEQADPDFMDYVPTPAPNMADPKVRLHEIFVKSSPLNNLKNSGAAFIIHHGESDDIVPIQWSIELAAQLDRLGKPALLYTYPGEGHVFAGWGWQLFMTRTLAYFDDYLKPRESLITVDRRVLRQERVAADESY